ncbi:hypothetical protein GN958_ATG19358, partial [Phytophthora infestans]
IEAATYPVSLRASPEIKLLRHQQDRRAEATKPSLPQGLEKRRPSRYDHDRGGPPAQGYHNANVHVFGRGV